MKIIICFTKIIIIIYLLLLSIHLFICIILHYLYTCMHACMHACIHTYVRTCVRACVRTYIHTSIAFVDPKNIYLDTKIMFLCHLETEISIFEYFVTHEILGDGAQIQT